MGPRSKAFALGLFLTSFPLAPSPFFEGALQWENLWPKGGPHSLLGERFWKKFQELLETLPQGDVFRSTFLTQWRETPKAMILVVKGANQQNMKVSFKNGLISLSSSRDTQKKQQDKTSSFHSSKIQHFQQTFPPPMGTDPTLLQVEQKGEDLHIIFPKIKPSSESRGTPLPPGGGVI